MIDGCRVRLAFHSHHRGGERGHGPLSWLDYLISFGDPTNLSPGQFYKNLPMPVNGFSNGNDLVVFHFLMLRLRRPSLSRRNIIMRGSPIGMAMQTISMIRAALAANSSL